jgi:uncharacterized ubiquitin-like protein YukD
MKKLIFIYAVFAFPLSAIAQVVTLPEVEVTTQNYKYLDAVQNTPVPKTVEFLERYATKYDLKNSEYYYEKYFVSIYIPSGKILGVYDKEGNILRTVEKYQNVALPNIIAQSVKKNFSGWKMTKNVFLVHYHNEMGVMRKEYTIVLEKGNQGMRIKLDDKGVILS